MKELTARQQRILEFLRDFISKRGYPPSIRDIERGCQVSSTSVVHYNLKVLERGGHLRRDPEISRGIELMDGERTRIGIIRVPIIGQIAAGSPIPVPSEDTWATIGTGDALEVPQDVVKGKESVYALRVRGTSMIDALINDGDIVLMQQASTAENGDMVAAWLKSEREATLKKFYQEPGRVRLQPANSTMQPIYVDPANLDIQGKVIGVIRQLS